MISNIKISMSSTNPQKITKGLGQKGNEVSAVKYILSFIQNERKTEIIKEKSGDTDFEDIRKCTVAVNNVGNILMSVAAVSIALAFLLLFLDHNDTLVLDDYNIFLAILLIIGFACIVMQFLSNRKNNKILEALFLEINKAKNHSEKEESQARRVVYAS